MRVLAVLLCVSLPLAADGEQDNRPDQVRPIPPPGVAVPDAERAELAAGLAELGREIAALRIQLQAKPALLDRLPDVEIYHKAVRYALEHDEFFNVKEIPLAKAQLRAGLQRAAELKAGTPSWILAKGNLAFGYVSRIDGSVQPYGLVVPASWQPGAALRHRLDTWFHGRGETLSEVNFIDQRQKSAGQFAPKDAFVLHLYGRYCNANKMAGEIDLLEALEDVRRRYPIDEDRIVLRGFSMGGAACWQFAVHYTDRWCAAAPGAGFSETPDFLKVFQNEKLAPSPWEQTLWHWYDCTDWAVNLQQLPTVAYSGEIDKQKQAADMMAKALDAEGLELTHLIGPKTAHKYHPASALEIDRRLDLIAAKGRERVPSRLRFTTWTLRYPAMYWIRVDSLGRHWERARVDADLYPEGTILAKTLNVDALTFDFASGDFPGAAGTPVRITLDGEDVEAPRRQSDRSLRVHYRRLDGRWKRVGTPEAPGLAKKHGLQGPVDDAFMDRFIMVRPTGAPMNPVVGAWAAQEMEHAVTHWRKQFRGDARVVEDVKLDDVEISASNLVLWGDPHSNAVLAKIAPRLPLRWTKEGLVVGAKTYPAGTHVPVLVFPNPLHPSRYVVLNSGFTFREYDYLNNARQVAKLPDWAVIDVSSPPTSRTPGKVIDAGFFDERWELPR
jgi:pimeloyl-ACP methyl ester carboxylesterase